MIGTCAQRPGIAGLLATVLVTAMGVTSAAQPAALTVRGGLVIDHVTVVDPRDGRLQADRAIVIDAGRIVSVVRAGSVTVTDGAQRIDAPGKFVTPGFLDMHAHPLNSSGPESSLPLMLANGITGFRQMAGSDAQLEARRAGRALTPAVSPELLLLPGAILSGPAVATPEAAAAEIRKQKDEGADFIKVVDLPPATYLVALDTAKAVGLPLAGHLNPALDVREAARHGMRAIEHEGPTIAILLGCSRDEDAIRQAMAQAPPAPNRIAFDLPQAALKRMTANPLLLTDSNGFAMIDRIVGTFDEQRCRTLVRQLARSGLWQVPTLVRLEAMAHGDADELTHNPGLKYMSSEDRQMWKDVGETFTAKMTAENRQTVERLFALQVKLFKLFDEAGTPMLTGTDFGGQWLLPGLALHREFDLMAKAGASPLHVLQMTTINGARFLGREASMGTVAAGKQANLVLLDANPVLSVRNLHGIYAVVRDGTYYSRDALDAITLKAEQP